MAALHTLIEVIELNIYLVSIKGKQAELEKQMSSPIAKPLQCPPSPPPYGNLASPP